MLAKEEAAHSFDGTFAFAKNVGVSRAGHGTCDGGAASDNPKLSSRIAMPASLCHGEPHAIDVTLKRRSNDNGSSKLYSADKVVVTAHTRCISM